VPLVARQQREAALPVPLVARQRRVQAGLTAGHRSLCICWLYRRPIQNRIHIVSLALVLPLGISR
jgi:hypothetical protein